MGLLWDKNSTAYLGLYLNAETRKKILSDLLSSGKIIAVMVEDIKQPFYYLSSDDELMQKVKSGSADLKPRMAFVAPLDPLFWDKSLIQALWDFQYTWEIYTPAAKRKYAYYTLPVLYGERFVGRIYVVPDKDRSVLMVKGLWWEPGVRQTKKLGAALEKTLNTFSKFNGCNDFEISTDLL